MVSIEVFCCYARRDKPLLDDLRTHLMVFQRQGLITIWNDTDISPGYDWEEEVEKHLNTAHIILLLISADFIASDYCYSKEMKRAIERHEREEARVIPVILKPVYWQGAPFAKLQVLPSGAKPIISSSWHSTDEALLDVVKGVREAIKSFQATFYLHYTYYSKYVSQEVKKGRPISEVLTEYEPGLDILFQSIMDAARTHIVEVIKKGKPASKALKECSPGLEKIFRDVRSIYAKEVDEGAKLLQAQIERILDEVSAVGDGDLRVFAEVTPDALGVLADCINYLILELSSVIIRIQRTSASMSEDTTNLLDALETQKHTFDTIARMVSEDNASSESANRSMKYVAEKKEQLDTFMSEAARRIEDIRRLMDALYESVSTYRLPQIDADEQERIGNGAE